MNKSFFTVRLKIIIVTILSLSPFVLVTSFYVYRQAEFASQAEKQLLEQNQILASLWQAQNICDTLIRVAVKEKMDSSVHKKFLKHLKKIEVQLSKVGSNTQIYLRALTLVQVLKIKGKTTKALHDPQLLIILTQLENMIDQGIDAALSDANKHTNWFIESFKSFAAIQKIEFLIGLLMTLVISIYLSKELTNPLKVLNRAIARIASGYYGEQIRVAGRDDISQVQESFNVMSKKLHDSTVSRAYLLELLNSLVEPVLVIDQSGKIHDCNKSLALLTGYSEEQLKTLGFSALILEKELLANISISPRVYGMAATIIANDSVHIPVHLSATRIDAVKTDSLWVLTTVDQRSVISERLEHAHIMDKIKQNERLVALGTLSAEVAHRLNQPLTTLGFTLQQCRRELASASNTSVILDYLSVCKKEVERIGDSVKNILSYTRRSSTNTTLVPVNEVIATTSAVLADKAKNAKLKFSYDESLHNLKISGHADELSELFYILFQNAIDAAPNSRESLCIISSRIENETAIIEVADTCMGIEQERLAHIFEPFFSSKPCGQGTGLGLSIAKKIVIDHDGEIAVVSKVNHGTTFTIRLPI